jgi:TDG/mug DNA glycosylase family protein
VNNYYAEEDKLDDVLGHGLKVVFCGTAAGTVSAELGQYYAGPGNKFWKTLHRIGLTERELDPAEFRTLPARGIGNGERRKWLSRGQAG